MRYDDVIKKHSAGQLVRFSQTEQTFTFTGENGFTLQVIILSDTILRFRYSPDAVFARDFSYAFANNQAPKEQVKQILVSDKPEAVHLYTAALRCSILKNGLAVQLFDKDGQLLLEEQPNAVVIEESAVHGITRVSATKLTSPDEAFFGLGDKASALNLRGKTYQNWCEDAFAFWENTDAMYRAIPFYYGLREGRAYGVFFDNSYRSHFEFGVKPKKQRGLAQLPPQTSFAAEGGELNYYFIAGPELTTVARRFATLTGKPELPPLWALGYHQCRWSYYPESRVKEITEEFRRREIPCDAIWLDIDYMDGYRCFTWNKNYFPDPTRMISELKAKGFKTVVMIDPGIKVDNNYSVYSEGLANDHFVKMPDGRLAKGSVWPDDCAFPDYTRPATRTWWANLYKDLIQTQGVAGVWNDMNEPATFETHHKTLPLNAQFNFDGLPSDHRKAHNIYGLTMAQATFDGVKQFAPDKRPFVLSRASYVGGQRYAALWTGDNIAAWEHLRFGNRQCQRLAISGFSFVGTDIGGFVNRPDGELFVRWLQLGIFHPLMRTHTMGDHSDGSAAVDETEVAKRAAAAKSDQEPWSFGENYALLAKAAIELRYRLLPYLYTAFRRHTQDGTPVLLPLSFAYQQDARALKQEDEFMFGEQLLVSPVVEKGQLAKNIRLPEGDWFDFHTNKHYKGGAKSVRIPAPLSKVPIMVKAGTVLPLAPIMQYVGEKTWSNLTLNVYYKEGLTQSTLYTDQNDGYAYQNGQFNLRQYTTEGNKTHFTLTQSQHTTYTDEVQAYTLNLIGLPSQVKQITIDSQAIPFTPPKKGLITLEAKANFERLVVSF